MAFLTEEDRKYTTPEDICAHLGDEYDKFCGAIVPPIFQNTLFVQPTEANGVSAHGYAYTRVSNPTTDVAERKIAALEGGDGALCFGSGMAAISTGIMYYMKANCHVVLVASSYGGAQALIKGYFPRKFGVTYTLVEGNSVEEIEAAIRPETTLIYLESPCTFTLKLQDLEAVAAIAKARGIGTVIDNTYATPLHQQPLKHGIDIVCHTASKYLGGHSDIVGGVLVSRREIIEEIQNVDRTLFGGIMDPHASWLLIRGLRTLPLRLKQHGESGKKVAAYLEKHPKVQKVFYPGSETYEQKELFEKYLTGTNGLMSFVPNGEPEDIQKFVGKLHCFQSGVSWGGFESLAVYIACDPDTVKHGNPRHLVRLHVGLENADHLIADLEQALECLPE